MSMFYHDLCYLLTDNRFFRTRKYVAIKALTSTATELDQRGVIQEVEFTSAITCFIQNVEHKTAYCTQYISHFAHQAATLPDEPSNHLCLVLELCMSVVDRIKRLSEVTVPSEVVKKILREILHGLCQLRALNCVHTGEYFVIRSYDHLNHVAPSRPETGQLSLPSPREGIPRDCRSLSPGRTVLSEFPRTVPRWDGSECQIFLVPLSPTWHPQLLC